MCVHAADLQKGKGSLPALCAGSALQRAVSLSLGSAFQTLHIPRHPSGIHHPIRGTLSQVPCPLRSFGALSLNIFCRIKKISDPLNKLLNQLLILLGNFKNPSC